MANLLSGRGTNIASAQLLDYRLKQEGYSRGAGLPGEVRQQTLSLFVGPILEYNSDINAGNPDKPLVLGSLTFLGDEESYRKEGIVAGIRFGGDGRIIYGEGRYLDYGIGAGYSYSPKHGIGIKQGFASLCSKNDIGRNYFMDGCLTASQLNRDLSEDSYGVATISLAKLFSDGYESQHMATIGLSRYYDDEYEQNQIRLSLETLHSSGILTGFSFSFGESVEDTLALRNNFSFTVSSKLMDKPVSASLSVSKSDGGKLFGVQREDTAKSIILSYRVHPSISIQVGYRDVDSTIDYFSQEEVIFGIQFSPVRF